MFVPGGTARLLPPGAMSPLMLAMPVLAIGLMLPWPAGWICAVGTIVVLGIPHGALDVEIGRTLLRHRLGLAWFPVFALPYLALVGLVLLAWRWMPEATLAAFLLASVWHFGSEDTGGGGLPAVTLGGIPICVPVLLHPVATAQVLSAATGLALELPPIWLVAGSLFWLLPATLWAVRAIVGGHRHSLALPALMCGGFAVLPPLTAFALYFVTVHAPAHTAALIRHPTRAPRLRHATAAWRLALPTTVLTVLIGAALWTFCPGEPAARLVCVTLQLLAALTLPHMLLDAWLAERERVQPVAHGAGGPPRIRPI